MNFVFADSADLTYDGVTWQSQLTPAGSPGASVAIELFVDYIQVHASGTNLETYDTADGDVWALRSSVAAIDIINAISVAHNPTPDGGSDEWTAVVGASLTFTVPIANTTLYTSTDFGLTWTLQTDSALITAYTIAAAPATATRFLVATRGIFSLTPEFNPLIAEFTDPGGLNDIFAFSDAALDMTSSLNFFSDLAYAPDGSDATPRWYACGGWTANSAPFVRPLLHRSTDDGATWTDISASIEALLTDPSYECVAYAVGTDNNGNWVVVCMEYDLVVDTLVFVAVSTDNGTTWAREDLVSGTGGFPPYFATDPLDVKLYRVVHNEAEDIWLVNAITGALGPSPLSFYTNTAGLLNPWSSGPNNLNGVALISAEPLP